MKSDEQLDKEMVENTDKDLTPHGEGMTPVRLARLEKAMQFTGKNKATVLATAKVKLTKKGTYTCNIKYAGDTTYSPIVKKISVVIK